MRRWIAASVEAAQLSNIPTTRRRVAWSFRWGTIWLQSRYSAGTVRQLRAPRASSSKVFSGVIPLSTSMSAPLPLEWAEDEFEILDGVYHCRYNCRSRVFPTQYRAQRHALSHLHRQRVRYHTPTHTQPTAGIPNTQSSTPDTPSSPLLPPLASRYMDSSPLARATASTNLGASSPAAFGGAPSSPSLYTGASAGAGTSVLSSPAVSALVPSSPSSDVTHLPSYLASSPLPLPLQLPTYTQPQLPSHAQTQSPIHAPSDINDDGMHGGESSHGLSLILGSELALPQSPPSSPSDPYTSGLAWSDSNESEAQLPMRRTPSFIREQIPDSDFEDTDSDDSDHIQDTYSDLDESESDTEDENELDAKINDFMKHGTWSPYPSAAMCVLDIMSNLPRHPTSDATLKLWITAIRVAGAPDVPTFHQLKKFQASLRDKFSKGRTKEYVSALGNRFSTNQIPHSISLNMSNPPTRKHLCFYPEMSDGPICELRHGSKWLDSWPDSALTPMIDYNNQHYYVNEMVQLKDSRYFIPLRWFTHKGEMRMIGYNVVPSSAGLRPDESARVMQDASMLWRNLPALESLSELPAFSSEALSALQHNSWRAKANGRKCLIFPIILAGDDVSGNVSKAWNKHNSFYMSPAGLPVKFINQEFFIRFVSTSQHAGPLEQVAAITEQFKNSCMYNREVEDTGFPVHDCLDEDEALMIPRLYAATGDNPWLAELCSHPGMTVGCPCRFCEAGGLVADKISIAGFRLLLQVGTPRDPCETRRKILSQLTLATVPQKGTQLEADQKASGVQDNLARVLIDKIVKHGKELRGKKTTGGQAKTKKAIQEELIALKKKLLEGNGEDAFINALLSFTRKLFSYFNPHLDTPLDLLHLFLLGFAKYYWGICLPSRKTEANLTIAEREAIALAEIMLASLDPTGCSDSPLSASYIIQYRGSLVGRHFQFIIQLAVFFLERIIDSSQMKVWAALGPLAALAYSPMIDNMEDYTARLRVLIDNFIIAAAQHNPTWLLYKGKFHLLPHLPDLVKRFSVLSILNVSRYEKFHGVFRRGYFADIDRVAHTLSGGFYPEGHEYRQAGQSVLALFKHNGFGRMFGLNPDEFDSPGLVHATRKAPLLGSSRVADLTSAAQRADAHGFQVANNAWFQEGKYLISQHRDRCKPGNFVMLKGFEGVARIAHIFVPTTPRTPSGVTTSPMILLDTFTLGEHHPTRGIPMMKKDGVRLAAPVDVLFLQLDIIRKDQVQKTKAVKALSKAKKAMLPTPNTAHSITSLDITASAPTPSSHIVPPSSSIPNQSTQKRRSDATGISTAHRASRARQM
ncbi:hypothetical protein BOTBODRAFT_145446 [Botryobasidium botryosum FD-172 SS1]|uniref:C2H2-type domain-containing protein n=1 Tax=Botryobasidium botryosum (strain FD-172 SS1) TaxID=930990 RepID=A0A067MGJ5_BOTB1|nr:hypothetical protein BOTBODRAFT_145446 [Botryobasidium botryosum FD-172 SS1]